MNYLYGLLSFVSFKMNMPTFARGFFKKSMSMQPGSKEPGISLYLRSSNHAPILEIIERINVNDQYKAYLKAMVHRHEKNYRHAYQLIEYDTNPGITGFKVRLLYDLKKMGDIVAVSKAGHDVLKDLNGNQQRTLLKYMLSNNMYEEADHILGNSTTSNEALLEEYEDAKNDVFYKYNWTQYKTNVLGLDDFYTDDLLDYKAYMDGQDDPMQGLGYVLIINQYFDRADYEAVMNETYVPYVNAHKELLQYIDPAALYHLDFSFEDESDESIQLQNALNRLYIGQDSDRLKATVVDYIKRTNLTFQHIFTIRRLLIDEVLSLEDDLVGSTFAGERKVEPVFYNVNLFTDETIKDSVDDFVHKEFNEKQKKRIYSNVIRQFGNIDSRQRLPKRLLIYLEGHHTKMAHTLVLARQYYITDQHDKVEGLIRPKSKDRQLKVRVQLASFLFNTKNYRQSLHEIEAAYEIKPKNSDVLRGLIRAHHILGDITKRYEYLLQLKRHNPARIFPGEFQLAEQEYQLQMRNWELSGTYTYHDEGTDPGKVLYVLNKALPVINGYTIRSNEIIKRVKERGFTPVVTTRLGWSPVHENYDIPQAHINGVETYYIDKSDKYLTNKTPVLNYFDAYAREMKDILDKEKPGVIHAASNFQNALPALKLGQKFGIKTIYEVRGMWHHTQSSKVNGFFGSDRFNLQEQQEFHCCDIADEVFCISESLKDYLVRHGVDRDKITVLPNGVNTEAIAPEAPDQELIEKYDLKEHHVIGFVGSITNYEGLDLVIKAIYELNHRREIDKRFKLLIVGDGQYRGELQNLTEQLNLQDDIIFTGRVPHEDIARYYSVMDIAPFPRVDELVCRLVTPIKPYEAMSMAKKVVVSDVDALKEMVIDGVNGSYFKAGDLDDLIDTLQSVLDKDEIEARAREWVIEERDWEVLLDTVTRHYTKS